MERIIAYFVERGVTKIIRIFGGTLFEVRIDANYADGEDFSCSSNHFVDFYPYLWYTLVKENTQSKEDIKMADQDFRERVLETLSRIETQARENNARLEKRLDSLDTRVGVLERDVGWIKRKLESKQEGSNKVLTVLTVCTAVGAAIIALIALLT